MSYLFQRGDFPELITASAEAHGIGNPAIVEKDYYVTEALRLIAKDFEGVVIFKGGTSLSKGWKLIDRFSEDIDLYVAPLESPERTLVRFETIADAVTAFPGFKGKQSRLGSPPSLDCRTLSFRARSGARGIWSRRTARSRCAATLGHRLSDAAPWDVTGRRCVTRSFAPAGRSG